MDSSRDVIVVGGGIVGLSAALALADAGLRVLVLEAGEAMREASWAAAGMLAAGDPENPPALRALSAWSLGLYGQFLERVTQLSGLHIPLRTAHTLQEVHGPADVLTREEVHAWVPELRVGERRFTLLEEQSLDPRDLCQALPAAVRAAGVELREHTPVAQIKAVGESFRLVGARGETWITERLVLAAGAWTQRLVPFPVEPRKGQMLALELPTGGPRLRCVVRTPEFYLVPRSPTRVIVGATVEHAGFDRAVRAEATEALLRVAAQLWPPVAEATVAEAWTGLRPATPDALPVLGRMPGQRGNMWVATGHFRNGILLAPGTARLLREWALGRPTPVDCEAFAPERFAPVPL